MIHGKILCIDDELKVLSSLRRMLESNGHQVFLAVSGKEAMSVLEKEPCDIALIDYLMPEMNGIELIRNMKIHGYETVPIILTAYGDTQLVVQAIKEGAYDFIVKPWEEELLLAVITKVLQYKKLLKEKEQLKDQLTKKQQYDQLIGISPAMRKIFAIIEKVKNSSTHILIQGESGTGKEQIAKAIHKNSNRKDHPFIPVDCNAINPNVIESELFGHVKGAFTGAFQAKEGLFRSAGKGTIFLDEVAEIPVNLQPKLLRAIQEMMIKPVGCDKSVSITARLIAATNKNIKNAIEDGSFREDLFYRLNVVSIVVPPLRERKEDIPLLVDHFIEKYNSDEKEIYDITPDALSLLMNYPWPGNIRQLENYIARAFTLGSANTIRVQDLPKELKNQEKKPDESVQSLKNVEREHIIKAIIHFKGNIVLAAKQLGIGKSTLYNKLKEYKIDL
ncbi:sigma-54-dependent transcriptional regulator [candidate division KSB1 bacterium]